MAKDIKIGKGMYNMLKAAVQNILGFFDSDFDDESKLRIIRSKTYEIRDIMRDIQNYDRLNRPSEYNVLSLDERISRMEQMQSELKELESLSKELEGNELIINMKKILRLQTKINNFSKVIDRLIEKEKEIETGEVEDGI